MKRRLIIEIDVADNDELDREATLVESRTGHTVVVLDEQDIKEKAYFLLRDRSRSFGEVGEMLGLTKDRVARMWPGLGLTKTKAGERAGQIRAAGIPLGTGFRGPILPSKDRKRHEQTPTIHYFP